MKCKNCNKAMELEEYYTDFLNEEEICLREEFWCAHCGVTALKQSYYKKESEDIEYGS